ncbi:unnamed protein product [Bursaphelenchus okinawaensis]|uniref:Uncharacterized protein n=1 Tax=Bursaphelenchus okinawaensis TaxID=465554 RepID=A0A811KTC8_9BILA|nr:unnamed protein product [Bursaphelenchus okinawaensis]CAG9112313.1 unnamed protein product [Bursaphelenchus okinawaensis]
MNKVEYICKMQLERAVKVLFKPRHPNQNELDGGRGIEFASPSRAYEGDSASERRRRHTQLLAHKLQGLRPRIEYQTGNKELHSNIPYKRSFFTKGGDFLFASGT